MTTTTQETIDRVVANLDNTIKGKEALLISLNRRDASYEAQICAQVVGANVDELKRIRDDLLNINVQHSK